MHESNDTAALVALATAFPEDVLVHAQAWERLFHLIHTDARQPAASLSVAVPRTMRDTAVAAGAIEALHASLMRHGTDPELTEWACCALFTLVKGHNGYQARAGAVGVVPALLTTLTRWYASSDIVRTTLFALYQLTMVPDNATRVAAVPDGRVAVMRAQCQHRGNKDIQEAGTRVLTHVPWASGS